jgi:hypothetical protein
MRETFAYKIVNPKRVSLALILVFSACNTACGKLGSAASGSTSEVSLSHELPPDPEPGSDFAMQLISDKSVTTDFAAKSTITETLVPRGGTPPYTATIDRLERNGLRMPTSQKLVMTGLVLSWTVDPTYFGDYKIIYTVKDSQGLRSTSSLNVRLTLPAGTAAISSRNNAALLALDVLWSQGRAAGNLNDWYANHDNLHASYHWIPTYLPQARVIPSDSTSFQLTPVADKVVIGNASRAYMGDVWASLPRYHSHASGSIAQAYNISRGNNLFWYPEHVDHDTVDYFHINQMFSGISQGSSGSEGDEVVHEFYALAAFRPEVKSALTERGLLMNVLQMARRRTRVADDATFMTGVAHTSAFDNVANENEYRLNLVNYINGISADKIPAVAELSVVSETFMASARETLYTGPWLVNRIYRGLEKTKQMRLSAANSRDLNGRALSYHWRVLRGDPGSVRITPVTSDFSVVDIAIDYHAQRPAEGIVPPSNRVDIGLFVYNGHYYSAPALVTSYTLNSETRVYDANGALVSTTPNANYVHPYLN